VPSSQSSLNYNQSSSISVHAIHVLKLRVVVCCAIIVCWSLISAVRALGSVVIPGLQVPSLCTDCAKRPFTPRCQVRVENTVVDALRDTGSDVCLVRRSLVPPQCMTGRVRTIAFADSCCRTELPIAAAKTLREEGFDIFLVIH
jgi:hypothetical protein